ncbi:LysR family transcriptional regulator [Caballeronia sp. INDeC2]|uniref:LysR family transcriptional regulator n=1 Tax=Caballeronia sp. INDeC2 TaxID=2921747 RepID=UPI00254191BD|nr:LysR family transcriptional regulator [Caballeronia sp. INDeC2]
MNFTRAAEELHVSQAAVSKQIRQLELGLGFALFERVGRRVQLSLRGAQLHSKVSAAFNYLADAVDELSEKRSGAVVTLAANTAISHFWLSEVMKDFHSHDPLRSDFRSLSRQRGYRRGCTTSVIESTGRDGCYSRKRYFR